MGQAAHKKMKNKKRTNTTANQDGKNTKQTNIPTNGQCVNGKLKVSQSDSECQNVELESETQTQSQKTKNASKTKIVLKPEDLGIAYTENLILKQGVKREELLQEKFGMQQLSILATLGDVEKARVFFESDVKRDPNERVECNGCTPLMLAADNKHVEIVKLLLENGADCTLTNNEGNNALMSAIKSGDADVINAIWPHRAGLDLNHANKNGYTALHFAADRKWECCVQFLLANGASPNCKTTTGETALMFAARHGDKKTAERLIQAKADLLLEDSNGRTAICLALLGSKKCILEYLLEKLPVEKSEIFLKSRLYYLKHPFMEDYREFCDVYMFRLLLRLTAKSTFRDAFYNQKVVAVVLDRMREIQLNPQDMIQLSCLLCSIMFMFKKQADVKLIKQFIYNGGPDFTIEITRYYTEKMNIMQRDTIIYYLPVIGITEASEGVAWLKKNALRVSEYSNFFCGNLTGHLRYAIPDVLTELDPDFAKVLTPVWKTFHKILYDIQLKQREKTMMKLLEDEEREKERKVKKREKKQQKRQIEKGKKLQKQDEPTDSISQSTKSESVAHPIGTIEVFQNSNDNENESASRSDVKNKKKGKKNKIEILKNISDTVEDASEIDSDYVADQMLAFSCRHDSWKTVQPKRQNNKDKAKEKQETFEVEKKEQTKDRKGQTKGTRKGQEKWKQQRERVQVQPSCWADIAKGVSSAKATDVCNGPEKLNSEFSYEDEFPTLDGTKTLHTNKDTKPDTNDTQILSNTSEDDIKGAQIYNTQSSGNQSSPLRLSLNSPSCEVDPCGADEKYYSDEEALAYSQQQLSMDAAQLGWEEMAEMNDIRCTTNAPSMPGFNTVTQMNSDTLQYLVDAYIASDNNLEGTLKCSNTENSLTTSTISHESSERNNVLVSVAAKENTIKLNDGKDCTFVTRKNDDKNSRVGGNEALKGRISDEKWGTPGMSEQIWQESRKPGTDMQVTQGEYARDPSPTKAPRKRFLPPRLRGREQVIRDEGLQANQTNLWADLTETTSESHYSKVSYSSGPICNQSLSSHQESKSFPTLPCQEKESEKQTTFGEDNGPDSEDLPTWYTYNGPMKIDCFSDTNDRETGYIAKHQRMYPGTPDSGNIQYQPSIPAAHGVVIMDCTKDDDITNDPCVVQYWTQANRPSLSHVAQFQNQHERYHESSGYMPGNTMIRKEPSAGPTEVQNCSAKNTNRSSCAPTDVAAERLGKSGNQTQRKTAIVKPISKQWKHARHSVNSALGQSILENAMRIDTTPDEVLYPSDLRGSPETSEIEDSGPDYFPSFHDETRLSSNYHPDAISVFHRLQQMQLIQLKDYYDAFRGHLLNKMSVYQSDFQYYASCTGLTHQQLNDYLGINEDQQQMASSNQIHQQAVPLASTATTHVASNIPLQESHSGMDRQSEMETLAYNEIDCRRTNAATVDNITPSIQEKPKLGDNTEQTGQRAASVKPVQLHQFKPTSPDNYISVTGGEDGKPNLVKAIARDAGDLAKKAVQDIKAAYSAMVANSIKSRRWKEKLLDIRHMPLENINVIGNIVFPKVNQARYVISSRPETIMLGFVLNGTPVAVRIVNWRSRHLIRDDLQHLIDMDVSKYFMSKYRAFSFLNGNYYIATDLYEYTLDDYLYKLKTDRQDSPLGTHKLIWQFMRGLNSIHQQLLMVHGELRPSNIVLDYSGNLRITGYGLGRRINSANSGTEISAEERCWVAPEILTQEQGDTFKADIWSAGMIIYFILSGGEQPVGTDSRDVAWSLSRRQFRKESISEEAFHLVSTMVSLNKAERPATSEALRHPYFWAEEKRLRFILIAGSDVLRDLKAGIPMTGGPGDSMIDILNSVPSPSLSDWMSEIDQVVMKEMRTFRQYKNTVVEVVLFVYNCCLHFEKMSAKAREIIDEPCKFFLTRFPSLFMTVYGAIKISNRTEKTCYKPFF